MNLKLLALGMLFSSITQASVIAVIDSGTDYKHVDLKDKYSLNSKEIPDNDRDEDNNGYQDDFYGWSFADNSPQIIDYKYQSAYTADAFKFFEIQTKNFYGKATAEEIAWVKAKVKDQAFLKNLQILGNFVHGTHVSGITVRSGDLAKCFGIKLIPTEVKLPGQSLVEAKAGGKTEQKLIYAGLDFLASQSVGQMVTIARYVADRKADVANGSFGTGVEQAKAIINIVFKTILRRDPTQAEVDQYASYFLNALNTKGAAFVSKAPKTLFVFAAGNDGSDNDKFKSYPASIKADNTITVAASLDRVGLANFSNYGKTLVDVAAPGVGIISSIPLDRQMQVSGTSQAAPYVANIAAVVKDVNPKLSPLEIKKIIMQTVDSKEFLKGKVVSSGIVNLERAEYAAILSKTTSIDLAISQANIKILDVNPGVFELDHLDSKVLGPVFMSSAFKL